MKKLLITIIGILIIVFCLSGCYETMPNELGYSHYYVSEDVIFVKIPGGERNGQYVTASPFDLFVHKETKVMYIWYRNGNATGLTVLLDSKGNPMLWEGDL